MGDTTHLHHHHQTTTTTTTTTSSRLGLRNNTGGEIVEVQGGHIVRSTGRKDRHSKVCTAKGPRDRRVRLSAHTAIQFYDVQDRLGYDRPSKAVDWLIKKAKSAIDELAELPAWKPTIGSGSGSAPIENQQEEEEEENRHEQELRIHHHNLVDPSSIQNQNQQQLQMGRNQSDRNNSFLPPSLDSDAIADTIKSFFPMGASAETNSPAVQFQTYAPPDLLSRTSSQSQDLRLSLQSFQDPILLNHQQQQQSHHQSATHHHHHHQSEQQTMFSGNTQLGFDNSGWTEHQPGEINRFQRMFAWNSGGDAGGSGGGGGGGGFMFNTPPTPPLLQPLFGQNDMFSQRGPLQSSNTPSVRAWIDPSSFSTDHHHHHHHNHIHQSIPFHPSSISGIGFASGGGGFSGFRIPARIQGEEEEHDGISDKPSSASSDSRH